MGQGSSYSHSSFKHDVAVNPERAPEWLSPLARHRDIGAESAVSRHLSARSAAVTSANGGAIPGAKHAAVLMLFSGARGSASLPEDAGILLTHRTPTMRTHSGQMAFPGGRIDPGDRGPVDAALREAWEETGLDADAVTPLATLDMVSVRSNGYPVHPVVAYNHSGAKTWVASEDETDDVFVASLEELLAPESRLTVGWGGWSGPAFRTNGYLVWGFTAALLAGVFTASGWDIPWHSERIYDLEDALAQSRNRERHD
ncbi:NUDIX hydrolase [Corynebacterium lubricantis]|uniref:NUDIX hydrolase n=1 Tax=Corynebacterium lubricantis TaxID=541095 RepID=UPI0003630CEA|nr:CoA pyrophosphatase [Corynebacterium lubricantis]